MKDKKKSPKISIIVPVYNAECYLEESITSILNQSFNDFELILVNDGSQDKSKEICEKYATLDARIKLINTENNGAGIARNKGIAIAEGEYCYFFDADDVLLKDTFKIMNEEITANKADLYVFGFILTQRNNNKEIKKDRINLSIKGDEVRANYEIYMKEGKKYIQGSPWNKLFKTKNIKENGILYPDLRRNQDEVFIVRYMNTVKNVKFCDKIIYKHYMNSLKQEWEKFPKNYFDIRTELYKEFKKNIIKWNPNNKNIRREIDFMYICGIVRCFEYMFNPKWEMNKKSRKKYIKQCVNNNEVKKALEFLMENKKEMESFAKKSLKAKIKMKYLLFLVSLMKKQRINSIYIISKCIINIRNLYRNIKYKC